MRREATAVCGTRFGLRMRFMDFFFGIQPGNIIFALALPAFFHRARHALGPDSHFCRFISVFVEPEKSLVSRNQRIPYGFGDFRL